MVESQSEIETTHIKADAVAALSIAGVALTYPATRKTSAVAALKNLNLTIAAGQSVAILGPNGSGKSTLMKIISGLIPADRGTVSVFGATDLPVIRRRISVVFQSNGLDPHLTVEENLFCEAALYGYSKASARELIQTELTRGGLLDKRHSYVKTLSLGLARRVDLIRALLHRPQLLLLDEPTVGLDPVARQNFLEELERRRIADQLTILMTTHLIDEADRFARCIFIHQGTIVADDQPTTLRHNIGGLVLTLYDTANPAEFNQDIEWQRVAGGWCAIADANHESTLKEVANSLVNKGYAFTLAPPTLADVFANLTGTTLEVEDGVKSGGIGGDAE